MALSSHGCHSGLAQAQAVLTTCERLRKQGPWPGALVPRCWWCGPLVGTSLVAPLLWVSVSPPEVQGEDGCPVHVGPPRPEGSNPSG